MSFLCCNLPFPRKEYPCFQCSGRGRCREAIVMLVVHSVFPVGLFNFCDRYADNVVSDLRLQSF
jgi:hypothetical protein